MCKNAQVGTGENVVTSSQSTGASGVPKLAAGLRYLKEQLSAAGAQVLPSEECLTDFVLNAIEAAAWAQKPGESYVACLRREIKGRARFIVEWVGSGRDLIRLARKHGLSRAAHAPSRR